MSAEVSPESPSPDTVVYMEEYLAAKHAHEAALTREIAAADDLQVRDLVSDIVARAARAEFHLVQPGEVAVAREPFVVQPERPPYTTVCASALNLALEYESRKSNVQDQAGGPLTLTVVP